MAIITRALKYALGGTVGAVAYSEYASASSAAVHPTWITWPHKGMYACYDHAALRRGFEVYKQVCAACHQMEYLKYRHLVGVTHTEAEAKALAAENEIENEEPNEEGEMFMRPRGLLDGFPAPYKNEVEARLGNNGALPPPLSLIRNARTSVLDDKFGDDYIFHLLTGYMDPPAGVSVAEGMNYNPYFGGGAIGMAPPLYNEIIQYEDGTPATMSQLASDIVQFLTWNSNKHDEDMKEKFSKGMWLATFCMFGAIYMKRHDWAGTKAFSGGRRFMKQKPTKHFQGKPW